MIDKPVVLFSVPRSGSTWVQEYVSEYNQNFGFKKIIPYEFLNSDFMSFKIKTKECSFKSFSEKIDFLNSNKISFKLHLNQILDTEWANNYFKEFYKIKLLRKNHWEQFVSYTIQAHNNWNHKKEYNNVINVSADDIIIFINLLETCYKQNINYDKVFYYEDLSTDFLEKFFNIKCNSKFMLSNFEVNNRRNRYSFNIENYDSIKDLFYSLLSKSTLII